MEDTETPFRKGVGIFFNPNTMKKLTLILTLIISGLSLINAQVPYQRIDSIIFHSQVGTNQYNPRQKRVFEYAPNQSGQQLSYFEWNDMSQVWDAESKIRYNYTNNGKPQSIESERVYNGAWYLNIKTEYVWNNPLDTVATVIEYDGDGASGPQSWIPFIKADITYDNQRRATRILNQEWDEDSSKWLDDALELYNYDYPNNKYVETSFFFEDGSFKKSDSTIFTFNNFGQPLLKLNIRYNSSANRWEHDSTVYQYDQRGLLEVLYRMKSHSTFQIYRQEFTYNANDELVKFLFFNWDDIARDWELVTTEVYQWDPVSQIFSDTTYRMGTRGDYAFHTYYDSRYTTDDLNLFFGSYFADPILFTTGFFDNFYGKILYQINDYAANNSRYSTRRFLF